jgi:hypothetical protein
MEQYNFYNEEDKFVICQPLGGVNDTLCQIGHCIKYAEKFNRKLIIDTKSASDFYDHFSNYFEVIKSKNMIHPQLLGEDITAIHNDPMYTLGVDLKFNPDIPKLYPLDINNDSNEKYVLHRNFGGGFDSFYAVQYFKLLPYLADEIKQRKQSLGEYCAILIRHTDYQTDYEAELIKIRALNDETPLYVFTDNYIVQDFAKTLDFTKLYVNENLYKNNKKYAPITNVRWDYPEVSVKQINTEVLSDLFLAALSKHIYQTYIVGYMGDRRFENKEIKSGFVNLATELNSNRVLLDTLLRNR